MTQNSTVLVVDDDAEIREIVATVLEDDGYHVDTACDGADALCKANEHQPDAIILDAMMPVMDGWQFLEAWRARPPECRAPVVVVSAVHDWPSVSALGAKAYLSKPYDLATLEATLASVLQPGT